jgi:hypothetical protein
MGIVDFINQYLDTNFKTVNDLPFKVYKKNFKKK